MEIVDMYKYPHLAKFEMGLCISATQKRQDRELVEQFGNVDEEEENIWRLERADQTRKL